LPVQGKSSTWQAGICYLFLRPRQSMPARTACEAAVTRAMTDDMELQDAITEIIAGIF